MFMDNKKLLIGLILFLVITNIATILTVLVHTGKTIGKDQEGKKATAVEVTGSVPDNQRTQFFTNELNLDSDQQEKFREIHRNYMRSARVISADMSQLRDDLLEAMDQDQPDSIRMNNLSAQIGQKHTELKKLTVKYYTGLKAICKPDQHEKLYELIRKIIKPDGDVQLPQEGEKRGGGNGKGRGPWWRNQKDSVSKQHEQGR
jgi:Spy/CpxP family protein refolding chaperone